MKILIDINHPAHVHYFKNFIKIMESKGHTICVVNRDSRMINQLLDIYQIPHTIRNKRPSKKGTIYSLLNLVGMIWAIFKRSCKFHPDLYLGFASSACAITSFIFRKPCLLLDDTEHNAMNHKLYLPFCSIVLTPFYFKKELGPKQHRFNAYVEQLYLHSKYYKESNEVLKELSVQPNEYVLIRYIAYDAHHDLVAHPIPIEQKKEIIRILAKKYRVLLSYENGTDDPFFSQYIVKISPEKMHDLEANAKLMITEGATMASEAFVLGTPYIYINPLRVGNVDMQCEQQGNWAYQSCDCEEVKTIIDSLCEYNHDKESAKKEIENSTIDSTAMLVKIVENYKDSLKNIDSYLN